MSGQWRHIPTKLNSADCASRGLSKLNSLWLDGPKFLWSDELVWLSQWMTSNKGELTYEVDLKERVTVVNTVINNTSISPMKNLITYFREFERLLRASCYLVKFQYYLRNKTVINKSISCEEYRSAENNVLLFVQNESFNEELNCLKASQNIKKGSKLISLDPQLNEAGLIVIGGRAESFVPRLQIILPKIHHVVDLIVRHAHHNNGHVGREHTLAYIRKRYWIVNARVSVKRICNSIICKRYNGKLMSQMMTDLPSARVTAFEPAITHVGLDYFGPINVKYRRGTVKRYVCLFTCLSSRAVHLEMAWSADSDSFIQAFQRFMLRRGRPKDNGTNLVRGELELRVALIELNKVAKNLCRQEKLDGPSTLLKAPHMGGTWERLIKDAKKLLRKLCMEQLLTVETLISLLTQVEGIMNDQPLTSNSDDPSDLSALTPSAYCFPATTKIPFLWEFFMVKTFSVGSGGKCNIFWRRWIGEYTNSLQTRSKWITRKRNVKPGDLVLVAQDSAIPRGQWPLGRVIEVKTSSDNLVQSCLVKTLAGILRRPVTRLVLLEQDHFL